MSFSFVLASRTAMTIISFLLDPCSSKMLSSLSFSVSPFASYGRAVRPFKSCHTDTK